MNLVLRERRASVSPVPRSGDTGDTGAQGDQGKLGPIGPVGPTGPEAMVDLGDSESWVELAQLAEGQFANVDQRASAVAVETPFDEELAELSDELNQTFIPLGKTGGERMDSLVQQDINAQELSLAAAASRAQVKTVPLFAAGWDLVDAVVSERVDLSAVDEADLPASLRELTIDERELYLQEMQERRAELSRRIAELSERRRRHAAQRLEAKGKGDPRSFHAVVREAIRRQAEDKGFEPPER